jgi:hypothetical protein
LRQAFDLNVEKVLEHWSVAFAIRELIANALDEQALTRTREPRIFKDDAGYLHIADPGRGIRYEHLTQNKNAEKRSHPGVIGQFGMGLKDALAVFDRRRVGVAIYSPHAVITTGRRPKEGFPDVVTLHALVAPPADPRQVGSHILLTGITDEDVEQARRFFLRYSDERLLESTEFGDVVVRADPSQPARIYVKGLFVAVDLNRYRDEWNDSFSFTFEATRTMTASEQRCSLGRARLPLSLTLICPSAGSPYSYLRRCG